jgi:L-ascorbate metabolism protein UlaG (beta-lactamase superfamily)
MRIKWLGHSCFKITSKTGIRILTDPFDDNVGYKIPAVETDIITISHGHYDHNFTDCVKGNFEVLNKVGNFNVKDIPITGIHTFHDAEQGEKRGNNIVYIFELDGMKLCHLGDLGHELSPSQIEMIGEIDILLIPVGGIYTINFEEAIKVVQQLNPHIVIPMHYKTTAVKFNLEGVENFTANFEGVERPSSQVLEINRENINFDKPRLYILKYE